MRRRTWIAAIAGPLALAGLGVTTPGVRGAGATVIPGPVLAAPAPVELGGFGDQLDADGGRLAVVESLTRTVHVVERTPLGWQVVRAVAVPTTGRITDVAVSGDVVVVGAAAAPDGEVWIGDAAAGGTAARLAVPVVAGAPGDAIGASVDVDGDALVVGAPDADRAYVFHAGAAGWAPAPGGTLSVPQRSGTRFATGVAIDGDWLLADEGTSGPFDRVRAFHRVAGTWTSHSWLENSDGDDAEFAVESGRDLALDGAVAAIAREEQDGGDVLSVEILELRGGAWVAHGQVPGSDLSFVAPAVAVEGDRVAILDVVGGTVDVRRGAGSWALVDTAEVATSGSHAAVALLGPTVAAGRGSSTTPGGVTGGTVELHDVHADLVPSPFEVPDPSGDADEESAGAPSADLLAAGIRYAGDQITVWARAAATDDPLASPRWLAGDVALLFRIGDEVQPLLYQVNPAWRDLVGSDLVARFELDPGRRCGVDQPVWPAAYDGATWSATFPASCLGAPPATTVRVELVTRFLLTLDETAESPAVARGPLAGYWVAAADGSVAPFGDLGSHGDLAGRHHDPVAAIAAPPARHGYWVAERDGTVTRFGGAHALGGVDHLALNAPIVHIATTATGGGYWLLGADGGVFSFGDATFHGSTGGLPLVRPVVAMAADPAGRGYWFAAADGGVFAFGPSIPFHGALPAIVPVELLGAPIVGMAPTATGAGYWLVAADGGVFAFGDAAFHGSVPGVVAGPLAAPVVGIVATPTGGGYWVIAADGGVFTFGDAPFLGSLAGSGRTVVSLAG
jgi:hypothetical protein